MLKNLAPVPMNQLKSILTSSSKFTRSPHKELTNNSTENPSTCGMNCSNDNDVYAFHTGTSRTLLAHCSHTVRTLFADGSVRSLSASMSLEKLVTMVS